MSVPSHCKHNFSKNNSLDIRRVNTVTYGTEYLSFLGPKIRDIVPDYIKSSETMSAFKIKIKKWISTECPCRIYIVYLQGIGFI